MRFLYIKLSQASILFPVVSGLIYYRKLNRSFKLLLYFFLITILFEISASTLKLVFHNNMPGLHLYTATEFSAFSYVYYYHFSQKKLLTYWILVNTIMFFTVALADAFFLNGIWNPNTNSRAVSSILLISYTLIYFYQFFKEDTELSSWEYPMFWINTGVLVYFALNLFYFMFNRYLISNASHTAKLSLFAHAAINIVANFLYAQSFRCFGKLKMKS